MMDQVLERFVEQCPVAVMARLALQRAINAEWVDAVFEEHRQRQYGRELMFSTVVDLMSLVAMGLRPSLHAAAQTSKELTVSLAALYEKVNHTEPQVLRALVRGSAERLGPVMAPLRKAAAPWLAGYRIRIIDGNHLPASEKRLRVLRGFRGAALPGHALVVFDPDGGLVVDLVPSEDGHSSERTLLPPLLSSVQPGDLWMADRNFCTTATIASLTASRAFFLLREHGAHPRPTVLGRLRKLGRVETGMVYEQPVSIETEEGEVLHLRRIELHLDQPTENGDEVIRLLTNLPAKQVDGCAAARLYRRRWTIEGLFQRLESVLHSEVRTLGYPRGALLAFTTAVVAYNVLAVLQSAVEAAHDLEAEGIEVSTYYIAGDVRMHYGGMLVAVLPQVWDAFETLSPAQLSRTLLRIAGHVVPKTLRKHPRKPKPKVKKGYAPRASVEQHVATARVIREGGVRKRP